ncbi:MAG: hypothetical protein HN368_17945, partial [Spirochaetales bacterium]|nr:hypothetical protein [Spirochaetales bacterium]
TLLDILDIPYELTDGSSAMPVVRGETDKIRDAIVCGWSEFASGNAAATASVRTAEWNFVTSVDKKEPQHLFDLAADPDENTDVIAEHPDVAVELRGHVEAVVGQPLPATLNEVCDTQPSPIITYLDARKRIR